MPGALGTAAKDVRENCGANVRRLIASTGRSPLAGTIPVDRLRDRVVWIGWHCPGSGKQSPNWA